MKWAIERLLYELMKQCNCILDLLFINVSQHYDYHSYVISYYLSCMYQSHISGVSHICIYICINVGLHHIHVLYHINRILYNLCMILSQQIMFFFPFLYKKKSFDAFLNKLGSHSY